LDRQAPIEDNNGKNKNLQATSELAREDPMTPGEAAEDKKASAKTPTQQPRIRIHEINLIPSNQIKTQDPLLKPDSKPTWKET